MRLNRNNTTTAMKKNPDIPSEIAIPVTYYIDDDGKYVFDDDEMLDTLEERINEISLSVNRLGKTDLN
jgi:hypothetical protein